MSDNRPARYVEDDGRIIYRASSLGMCDKIFVALSMGYDPRAHPAWFQEILDEGTENESVIREMFEHDNGCEVFNVGKVLEMEILEGVWLRGSIDGMRVTEDVNQIPVLCEFKKIRDSGWQRYLRSGVEFQANYPMQTSAYMHMLEEELGVAVDLVFVGGHYVKDDKTEEWSITEVDLTHVYVDPPISLMAIRKRILSLEKLINSTEAIGDLKCNTPMFPCPMYYLHDDDMDETPVRPGNELIEANLKEWDDLDTVIKAGKAAEKRAKDIKEGVQAWLVASGQDDGDVSTVVLDDREIAVKYHTSERAAYQVSAGTVTQVTIKVTKRDGEVVAKAPGKSRGKGAPGKKLEFTPPSPEEMAKLTVADDPSTDLPSAQESDATPTPGKRLAPRTT